jgi:hypothetical protein
MDNIFFERNFYRSMDGFIKFIKKNRVNEIIFLKINILNQKTLISNKLINIKFLNFNLKMEFLNLKAKVAFFSIDVI